MNLSLHKSDELDSLIRGLLFIEETLPSEVYYWADPTHEDKCRKVNYDFKNPYPFLVVNIGSGVSILAVYGPDNYKRVTGTRWSSFQFFNFYIFSTKLVGLTRSLLLVLLFGCIESSN